MTATKQNFYALDSAWAAESEQWDAALQKELQRSTNGLIADLVQPVYSNGWECADSFASDYPASLLTRRVNAPPGAWTAIMAPQWRYVPPGCHEVEIWLQANIPSGTTLYAFAATKRQTFTPGLLSDATGVQSFAGTGATARYPSAGTWRVPVDPRGGWQMIAVLGQTVRFDAYYEGIVESVEGGGTHLVDTSPGFGRPTAAGLSTLVAEAGREDWWVRVYERLPVLKAYSNDISAAPPADYTDLTNINGAGTSRPFPYGPSIAVSGDGFLMSFEESPFDGIAVQFNTAANWLGCTTAWKYWTGAAWAALTEFYFGITDWTNSKTIVLVLWERPSNWASSDPSGTGNTGYYIKNELTANPTFPATEPLLDQGWILRSRVPCSRVIDGTAGNANSTLITANNRLGAVISNSDMYVAGRAEFAVCEALLLIPVQPPGIS